MTGYFRKCSAIPLSAPLSEIRVQRIYSFSTLLVLFDNLVEDVRLDGSTTRLKTVEFALVTDIHILL